MLGALDLVAIKAIAAQVAQAGDVDTMAGILLGVPPSNRLEVGQEAVRLGADSLAVTRALNKVALTPVPAGGGGEPPGKKSILRSGYFWLTALAITGAAVVTIRFVRRRNSSQRAVPYRHRMLAP